MKVWSNDRMQTGEYESKYFFHPLFNRTARRIVACENNEPTSLGRATLHLNTLLNLPVEENLTLTDKVHDLNSKIPKTVINTEKTKDSQIDISNLNRNCCLHSLFFEP